jgi:hypothetical protein
MFQVSLHGCFYIRERSISNDTVYSILCIKSTYKATPLQALTGTEGSRMLKLSDFKTSAYEGGKVVSPTHRPPLPPGNIPGTHFCYRLSRPQGHSAAGRIMSMNNSNDTIGNRSRDLPVCTAVPQKLRHRVPHIYIYSHEFTNVRANLR